MGRTLLELQDGKRFGGYAVRFSKLFETYQDWLKEYLTRPTTRYGIRIWSYMQRNPEATLVEAGGHKPKVLPPSVLEVLPSEGIAREGEVPPTMFRTTFVLKLPVSHRWKVMRRHIWSKESVNVDSELDRFLEKCGAYVHSKAYAVESGGEVGIEDNAEMAEDKLALAIGKEDDFYDAGGT